MMADRINKPKVFLSHSSPDKPFIEKLADDLRQCKIDYWLDTEEIRDGRSWLKIIFEDGIPTCDAVIVYLTENSIHSKMVEKELDATVVEQLDERGITLLPYVSNADIRSQLRSDIRALQCREWNDSNYQLMLPTVISEIWRSYLERTIDVALLQERNRRLGLELEMKKLRDHYESSVFAPHETQEFQYLRNKLDRKVELNFGLYKKISENKSRKVGTEVRRLSLLTLILAHLRTGRTTYDEGLVGSQWLRELGKEINLPDHPGITRGHGDGFREKASVELQTYGLVQLTRRQVHDRWNLVYEFSEKIYRLKYWMDYNNLSPDDSVEQIVRFDPESFDEEVSTIEDDKATARALEADQRVTIARRLNAWRTTGEGVNAATQEVKELFFGLQQRVEKSNRVLQNIKLKFMENLSGNCTVTNGDVNLLVSWITPSTNVSDSRLMVSLQAPQSTSGESSVPVIENRLVYETEFRAGVQEDLTTIWRYKDPTGREPLSIAEIADHCWSTMLRYIQRSEEGKLD